MKVFKDLTRQEKLELFTSWLDGKTIECCYPRRGVWLETHLPSWAPENHYRVKPKTLPSINAEHVLPKFNWLAVDFNGRAFLYENKPFTYDKAWYHSGGGEFISAEGFSSFKRGDCDWNDSLVKIR